VIVTCVPGALEDGCTPVMIGDHAVGELDGQNSLFGRRPLDALSVFVRSGEK